MARRTVVAEEPAPECDRIEGVPHPRETLELIGHEEAERALLAAFASGMPHGWILSGPRGIGKATLAYRLARAVLARPQGERLTSLDVPPGHPIARQVAGLAHPDLFIVRRRWDAKEKRFPKELVAGEVRRLPEFFAKTAGSGGWRVAIVDAADEMNAHAANALLKILEEPPRRALILLVSHAPGGLLPTIRSRVRQLRLRALGDPDMRRVLALHGTALDAEEEARLLALAEGSPGEALRLLNEGGLDLLARVDEALGALPAVSGPAHALATSVAGKGAEARYAMALALIARRLQDAIGARAAGEGAAPRLLGAAPLDVWIEVWETLGRLGRSVSSLNLERGASLLAAFEMMAAAMRGVRPAAFAGDVFREF
ncbi:MAG: DNA polymerase III subunit delta' [Alphaproteobacteria bacterium]|nr:DNA polymerase III subunit delta' [Alphaproteobacteria bacterium]